MKWQTKMACRAPISGTKQSYLSYLSSWVIYHHLSIIYPLYPPKKSSFSCHLNPLIHDPGWRLPPVFAASPCWIPGTRFQHNRSMGNTSGWWFQHFFSIYGMSSFPLTFIFFKMVKTTNQTFILGYSRGFLPAYHKDTLVH